MPPLTSLLSERSQWIYCGTITKGLRQLAHDVHRLFSFLQ
jgi:hypothetical protein